MKEGVPKMPQVNVPKLELKGNPEEGPSDKERKQALLARVMFLSNGEIGTVFNNINVALDEAGIRPSGHRKYLTREVERLAKVKFKQQQKKALDSQRDAHEEGAS
jgi:hypothetical protein